jgi:hypothetical protein
VQHSGDDHVGFGAGERREHRRDGKRVDDERLARLAHLAAASE